MSIRLIAAAFVALGLSACATTDTVSRNAPLDTSTLAASPEQAIARNYTVSNVEVVVPRSLEVSERNGYYPVADIVWRGDPLGDRHAQIEEIFQTAAATASADTAGAREVTAYIEVVRFHGVTERTRYSVGGVYNMVFNLTIIDNATGAVIEPARRLMADLPAPGGQAAIQLEQSGQTEKVRVLDYLTHYLRDQFTGDTLV